MAPKTLTTDLTLWCLPTLHGEMQCVRHVQIYRNIQKNEKTKSNFNVAICEQQACLLFLLFTNFLNEHSFCNQNLLLWLFYKQKVLTFKGLLPSKQNLTLKLVQGWAWCSQFPGSAPLGWSAASRSGWYCSSKHILLVRSHTSHWPLWGTRSKHGLFLLLWHICCPQRKPFCTKEHHFQLADQGKPKSSLHSLSLCCNFTEG